MAGEELFRIAVDIGGTFTDCVITGTSGRRISTKALTTPGDQSAGVVNALEMGAALLGLELNSLLVRTSAFVHGTTVGTNALITRTGARTGLLMTRGHEQAIHIGRVRQKITGLSEREKTHVTHLTKADPPIVAREDVRGITERIDARGEVVVPLNLAEAERMIDDLVSSGIRALAICLLWSFRQPAHEVALRDLVRAKYPSLFVSISSEIAPRLGEYERAVSTVLNSYIGPLVGDYLTQLERRLKALALRPSVLVLQSNGGLSTVRSVLGRPLLIVDSGPAGGVLGANHAAAQIGEENVLCADVGGTTFDVGLISSARVQMDPAPAIEKYSYLIPKIFVRSIGAGGGSIAWADAAGTLHVGPQSAGSSPGPVAYGRGGTEPTVTDALTVLGYLDPDHLLGRQVRLDKQAAMHAVARLGEKLGMPALETAAGILQISSSQMADLARKVTVERGLDPRDFALFSYGGAGPLFAAFIARELGAKFVHVPPDSGVFSAYGMLTTDIAVQEERSANLRSPLRPEDVERANRLIGELEERVLERFRSSGLPARDIGLARSVDMRFGMQVHELSVDVPAGPLTDAGLAGLAAAFTQTYERTYGPDSAYTAAGYEYVTFKVVGTLRTERPQSANACVPEGTMGTASKRQAYFPGAGLVETSIYDGSGLRPGDVIAGPAIIERVGDTVVLPPGSAALVDRLGGLNIS